jgi:DNA-binding NarL/FixJ family response regulator
VRAPSAHLALTTVHLVISRGCLAGSRGAAVADDRTMTQALAFSFDVVWPPRALATPRHPLSLRERQVVALAARGLANKVIASELGLHTSTVSVYLLKAARKLGVRGRVAVITAFLAESEAEPSFPPLLSPSERLIATLILRGATNAEIASLRGKSTRTIANQVASMFRKLQVASRGELAARFGRTIPKLPN